MPLSKETEDRALLQVKTVKEQYRSLNKNRRRELGFIYDEITQFRGEKRADWASVLKVNFANTIENKVTARLTAKNPKFIVSLRQTVDEILATYYPVKDLAEDASEQEIATFLEKKEEEKKFREEVAEWAEAVQTYLNFAFEEYGYRAKFRKSAKNLVRYGNTYATVIYKVEKFRKRRKGKIEEVDWREYPDVDVISWTEMFLDPRYIQVAESPAVIRTQEKVRKGELFTQDDIINLDKIKDLREEPAGNRQDLYSIKITDAYGEEQDKTFKYLTVDKYQGYFQIEEGDTPKDLRSESLYEIWTVNNAVVIKMVEIPRIDVHSAGCFEDTEQHYSVGYIEPMLGLEREYNYKMNSAIEYINQGLNRSWFWDPNSGVDPKQLANLGPGSIIQATKGVEAAEAGLKELEYRAIPQAYFAQNNEVRRDIQTVTHTVDTTAATSTQGFTNTATAIRARFFESNVVYADTLRHLEELWVRLGYDLIDSIAENAENDIIIAKLGKDKFKWAKPELFENAPVRYAINIEMGSSSFDNVENRREEALGFWTLAKDAKASGVNADLEKAYLESVGTFEKKTPEEYIIRELPGAPELAGAPSPTTGQEAEQIAPETPNLSNPAALTKAVVQGDLTA